uniref:site-2 protease family protein n=1 Tax=uncultured Allobacillus sp. TaxID=1638025 RepID=UPI0025978A6A|nr:site-2 protease family protein [uncultured Allobacillus sp.]
MNIKSIHSVLSVIQIHPLLLILLLLSYFFGLFIEMAALFLLIFIHECGHLTVAKYFQWEVTRLVIWPFGGVMETKDFYNRPTHEELWVTIAGPIQHIWIYGLIHLLSFTSIPDYYLDQFIWMNTILLVFNLLPILPLDGGRFLFFMISHWLPFHRSILLSTSFSIFMIFVANGILLVNGWVSPPLIVLSTILWLDNWFTYKRHYLYLMKHMLARYMYPNVERNKIHKLEFPIQTSLQEMMKRFRKNHYHFIQIENQGLLSEDDYLSLLFSAAPPKS